MILGRMKVFLEQNDNLSSQEQFSFDLLYAPLLSNEAYRLYHLLLTGSQVKLILDYSKLGEMVKLNMMELEQVRIELEKLWLLKTFTKDNNHYLRLLRPLKVHEFKNHEILGRLAISIIGSEAFQEIVALLNGVKFREDLTDITAKLDTNVFHNYGALEEEMYQEVAKMEIDDTFDMEVLLYHCGEVIFPKKLRTQTILNLIEGYAKAYKIDYSILKKYINESIPLDQSRFDTVNFKRLITINHQSLPTGDPLQWPPEKYLASLQKGLPVMNSELVLIQDLKEKYKFSNEVINTLLNYLMKEHNGSLGRNLVEKIASSWVRAKVTTAKEAQELTSQKKNYTPKKRTIIKKAQDDKPAEIQLDQVERERIISKIKGLNTDEEPNE